MKPFPLLFSLFLLLFSFLVLPAAGDYLPPWPSLPPEPVPEDPLANLPPVNITEESNFSRVLYTGWDKDIFSEIVYHVTPSAKNCSIEGIESATCLMGENGSLVLVEVQIGKYSPSHQSGNLTVWGMDSSQDRAGIEIDVGNTNKALPLSSVSGWVKYTWSLVPGAVQFFKDLIYVCSLPFSRYIDIDQICRDFGWLWN